jgi:hypothetical protein
LGEEKSLIHCQLALFFARFFQRLLRRLPDFAAPLFGVGPGLKVRQAISKSDEHDTFGVLIETKSRQRGEA